MKRKLFGSVAITATIGIFVSSLGFVFASPAQACNSGLRRIDQ